MFDLYRRFWFFEKDESAGASKPDDSAGKEPAKEPEKAGDEKAPTAEEKKFSQAELDQIVKDRLERERKKSDAAAEKAKKEAEDAALAKNQEWQQLAEKRQARIAELEQQAAELDARKAEAERYRKALDDQLAKAKASLPKHLLPLIDKLDPVEAMDYITEHAAELGAKPTAYSETPNGKNVKVRSEDLAAGEKASRQAVTRSF